MAGARDADEFRGKRLRGRGAATDERFAVDDVEFNLIFAFAWGNFRREFAEEIFGAAFDVRSCRANHAQRGDFVVRGAEIGAERGFERGDGEFVHAKRAEERVAADFCDEIFFAGDDAGLWAAKKFVAAEHHNVRASFDAVTDERLGDAMSGEVDEAAGAKIFDERQLCACGEGGKLCERWFVSETSDLEI